MDFPGVGIQGGGTGDLDTQGSVVVDAVGDALDGLVSLEEGDRAGA